MDGLRLYTIGLLGCYVGACAEIVLVIFSGDGGFLGGGDRRGPMHAGRWRTPTIALHYKHNSVSFKREVAAKIPSLPCPPTL